MYQPQAFLYTKLFKTQSYIRNSYKNYRGMVSYVQGQSPEPKIREYFYYVDHQGMLFLDDARMKNFTSCFKEKKFLRFFFNQLKINETARYPEFPYISLCGRERNFVRCDDYPIVYTHVIPTPNDEMLLAHNHAGDLLIKKFIPEKIFMLPDTGRVYHPAPEKVGGIGLVRSKLAIEFSKHFEFDNGEDNPPTKFTYESVTYDLDTRWYLNLVKKQKIHSTS
ncbi:unnamed protein product [Acanthoscelides obtectus]|uniref:Uncharacterized protein n=1 Tax=Acanthoscelides obtectus TaxID=200917 RepID=A0A9P0MA18_ACAOB|nr:unnamed protein product [Acanthoscelides obtectus]CAK1636085.1 hypothetical protein AOBTE_LOCUS9733 [Acanthoscelides obtectus]